MGLQKVLRLYRDWESILEVNAALNTLEAQAVEHPQFQEVRNIVYFLKRDLLMLSRRLGFYDLEASVASTVRPSMVVIVEHPASTMLATVRRGRIGWSPGKIKA